MRQQIRTRRRDAWMHMNLYCFNLFTVSLYTYFILTQIFYNAQIHVNNYRVSKTRYNILESRLTLATREGAVE